MRRSWSETFSAQSLLTKKEANQLFRNYEDKNGNTAWQTFYDRFNPKTPPSFTAFTSMDDSIQIVRDASEFSLKIVQTWKSREGSSLTHVETFDEINGRYQAIMTILAWERIEIRGQRMSDSIGNSVDGDFASERTARKSTTGMVRCLGRYTVRTTANLQTSVGVNVCECDFYALVYGATHGLRLQAYLQNIRVKLPWSWSQTCQVPNPSRGDEYLGKQRHFQKRYLWTQDIFAANRVEIRKIPKGSNVDESDRQENLGQTSHDIGIRGGDTSKDAQTILSRRQLSEVTIYVLDTGSSRGMYHTDVLADAIAIRDRNILTEAYWNRPINAESYN